MSDQLAHSSTLHCCLGHMSEACLKLMIKHGSLDGVVDDWNGLERCDMFSLSKSTELVFNHTWPRAIRFLENVHVDMSRINHVKAFGNESYYILFCDDYSSFQHVIGLVDCAKHKVFQVFMKYIALTERQTGCQVMWFTLDRGWEILNNLPGPELDSLGITLHLTAGHTPEQNGVSKRGNRTIITKARCLMIESGAPLCFWFLACCVSVFVTNWCVTKAVEGFQTPFEVWFFGKPSIHHLKVFGCQSFRLIWKEIWSSKYSPVSSVGALVGYDDNKFNFHIYDLKERKIYITPHATFDENMSPFIQDGSDSSETDKRVK